MRPDDPRRDSPRLPLCGLLMAALLFAALPAFAQDPVVTAADPNQAEQETYGLVVKITGNNFGVDSQVDFFATGTTNPGGIAVKNVKRRNAKTLEATIDVAPDALTLFFDIQVRTGGRTGKGTELFKVLAKPTGGGNDSTPPGDVIDLAVTAVDLSSVELIWTAPADDGYDATSGPAKQAWIGVHFGEPFTEATWADTGNHIGWGPLAAAPGTLQSARLLSLAPGSTYWIAVRNVDDLDNLAGFSNQVEVTTDPPPETPWLAETADGCGLVGQSVWNLDLELDLDGDPALLYGMNCASAGDPVFMYLARTSGTGWAIEALPMTTRDTRTSALGFDPQTGQPTIAFFDGADLRFYKKAGSVWQSEVVERRGGGALSMAYFDGRPTLAYKMSRGSVIRVATWTGSTWEKSDVQLPRSQNTPYASLQLAFDGAGNPAVAYDEDRDGRDSPEGATVAIRSAGTWLIEPVDAPDPALRIGRMSLAWDPVRADFTLLATAFGDNPWRALVRTCDRHGAAGWSCATLAGIEDRDPMSVGIVYDAAGTATVAYITDWTILWVIQRPAGSPQWSAPEYVTWLADGQTRGSALAIDPLTGRLALSAGPADLEERFPLTIRLMRRER